MNAIAVVGVGLIGGSMALKLRKAEIAKHFIGVDNQTEHLEEALDLGIIDTYEDMDTALSKADLVILATPVDASVMLLNNILDKIHPEAVVMDVGSTKWEITNAVQHHSRRSRFVAAHPMWGTENSGPGAATHIAFKGKAAVLCNIEESDDDAVNEVKKVFEALEMNVLYMDAAIHDMHTAYISHISHITSYALAITVLEKEKEEETIFQLASSGFSSAARLAKSHPEMWVPIFLQNRGNVLDVLEEYIRQLTEFKTALETENAETLKKLIGKANHIRAILDKT